MTIQDLKINAERCLIEEQKCLKELLIPDYNKVYISMCIIEANVDLATNEIYNTLNYSQAKKYFYKAAMTKIYLHEKFDYERYTSSNIFLVSTGFSYAIISDSSSLINRYLLFKDNFLDTFGSAFGKAIQASIQNDDIELSKQIEKLVKHTNKKNIAKHYIGCVNAFKGVLQKDKSLIELGIKELLSSHNKQEHQAVVKDFLNIEALTLAKLAYRKGIELNIESPLLPKEMIPVKELEHYEGYKFFSEID